MGHDAKKPPGVGVFLWGAFNDKSTVKSLFLGSCYSELACRIPVMGSSYLYSYAIFGEIIAFILGWSLVIESVITIALAAVTLSNHLDVLSGGRLQAWIKRDLGVYPWDGDSSPEILAAGIILFVAMMAVCRSKNVNDFTG